MGILYIVATPIGNLGDITLRALRALKEADVVLCEDTRVTQKLLSHFAIEKPLVSYHQHSRLQKTEQILQLLREGKNLALVSDAGTPGISDPGNELVNQALQHSNNLTIVPIPGPSALTVVASIAGFSMDKFVFLGFPPAKKGRKTFFEKVAASEYPVVLYESPYRIVKTLAELQPDARIVVGRELTKKFETIYRGSAAEVLQQLKKETPRGEFVLIISRG